MITGIDRVKCWISADRFLDREVGTVFDVKAITTTTVFRELMRLCCLGAGISFYGVRFVAVPPG